MEKLEQLLERYRNGWYTNAELMVMIAQLGNTYPPASIVEELPADMRTDFCKWVRKCPVGGWGVAIGSIGIEPRENVMTEFKRLASESEKS